MVILTNNFLTGLILKNFKNQENSRKTAVFKGNFKCEAFKVLAEGKVLNPLGSRFSLKVRFLF